MHSAVVQPKALRKNQQEAKKSCRKRKFCFTSSALVSRRLRARVGGVRLSPGTTSFFLLTFFPPSSFCQGDPTAGHFRVLDEDNSLVLNEPRTPGEVCSQLFKGQDSVEPGTRVCQLHQQALQPSPQQAKTLQLLKPSSAPKFQLSGISAGSSGSR